MSLETGTIERLTETPATVDDRRAKSERRGKERRGSGRRINRAAPRRSLLQAVGIQAIGLTGVIVGVILIAGQFILPAMPWAALGISLVALGFAILAYVGGCIEQRLIEIRLELMMANGGARQADRRQTDRRA